MDKITNDIETQLLFIVLGDSDVCCRVEVGSTFRLEIDSTRSERTFDIGEHGRIIKHPFADIRAAVDAMEGAAEKKVPRIEWRDDGFIIFDHKKHRDTAWYMDQASYDALCQIAGHPLTVYEAKPVGEWVRLYPFGFENSDATNLDNILALSDLNKSMPIKVWRYTRRRKGKQNESQN